MLKNGYIEAVVEKPVGNLKKDDVVFIHSNEIGQIGKKGYVRVMKDEKDKKGTIVPTENLMVKK